MSDTVHPSERVAHGTMFLDIHVPNWRSRLDLATLDMGMPVGKCGCVMAQLYGEYGIGIDTFVPQVTFDPEIISGETYEDMVMDARAKFAIDHGFERDILQGRIMTVTDGVRQIVDLNQAYEQLTLAWRKFLVYDALNKGVEAGMVELREQTAQDLVKYLISQVYTGTTHAGLHLEEHCSAWLEDRP